jgi:hypothetical protein
MILWNLILKNEARSAECLEGWPRTKALPVAVLRDARPLRGQAPQDEVLKTQMPESPSACINFNHHHPVGKQLNYFPTTPSCNRLQRVALKKCPFDASFLVASGRTELRTIAPKRWLKYLGEYLGTGKQ